MSEPSTKHSRIWIYAIIAILALGFLVRVYYFTQTEGQPLWWDEAEYGATAKSYYMGLNYPLNNQRPFLFPWLISLFFQAGLSEQAVKFLLVVIPSTFLIFATYLLGKEMFNEKIGVIAAFLMAVSWTFLFWSARLQPDLLSMVFQVMTIYLMWRYWKSSKTLPIVLAGVCASLGFNFKVSGLLVPAAFLIFILMKDRLSFFKNKHYWIFLATFLIVLIPQFIYSHFAFGSALAFITQSGYAAAVVNEPHPIAWYVFSFFYTLLENILFLLFLLGLALFSRFFLYADVLVKDKNRVFDPQIFSWLVVLLTLVFYVFYIRGAEDRWVFLWMPFLFFMIAQATLFIYHKLSSWSRYISLGIVLVLLVGGGIMQLRHADALIDSKQDTYGPVREAGLWLRNNSLSSDKVLSISYPQTTYYSERETISYSRIKNTSDLDALIAQTGARFVQVSVFEPHPVTINDWIAANQDLITPVQAYFADAEQKQPVLIIYEVNSNLF